VQGAAEGNLAEAMSRMLGVYVGLKGENVPENVKKWNVLKVRTHMQNCHFCPYAVSASVNTQ